MRGHFKLCPDLHPDDVCLVVEQYREGDFERRFHKHVPRALLADRARAELLRALVGRFSDRTGLSAEQIVSAYLNAGVETPPPGNSFTIVTSHPEPGVVRSYCGSATVAWSDHVFARRQFRRPQTGEFIRGERLENGGPDERPEGVGTAALGVRNSEASKE
jgi:hypothetical protein